MENLDSMHTEQTTHAYVHAHSCTTRREAVGHFLRPHILQQSIRLSCLVSRQRLAYLGSLFGSQQPAPDSVTILFSLHLARADVGVSPNREITSSLAYCHPAALNFFFSFFSLGPSPHGETSLRK